eukprot:15562-Heterococcus_DN1.PRE.1
MPLRKSAVRNALPAAACYHPLFIELLRTQMQWETLVTSIDSCTVMPEAALQQRVQEELAACQQGVAFSQ